MRVQLAQQVQELVGTSELVIITERVHDVALLIGHMVKMGFVEVLDLAYPPALAATRTQLGLDGLDLAGLYPHRRRSPEGVGGSVHPGHAPQPEPPEWAGRHPLGFQ